MKRALLILAAGIFVFVTGCGENPETAQGGGKGGGGFAVNVIGFEAKPVDLSDKISVVGTLEANESVEIKSEIAGKVSKIRFMEGQSVKEGDVLIEIEKEKLKAVYNQARANLKLAETTAERYEKLVQTRAVSQQEYDQTVATLESSRAAVELAREQLKDATITAPFDGVMGERLVSLGQFISQGTLLTYLINQDPMKAEFHVPERHLGEISLNQKVRLRVASYRDELFKGEVYFIDPQVDETTRTVLVKAYVPNPDGRLRRGMFANLELIVRVNESAVAVPETALIVKGDNISVFVVKDDQTVDLRPVQTGMRFDGMVEITSGIEPGETVVTEGYQKIGPGSKVNVRLENQTQKKLYEII